MAQVEDVSVRAEAAGNSGARRSVQGMAGCANGDFAVVADPDGGALAPDVGPPMAGGHWAQDRTVFGQSLVPGGLG